MFVISLNALRNNARILRETADSAGCKVALALKGFSCWPAFGVLRPYLDGCCASGLWEGRLAHEEFGKHVVTYSPAYDDEDIGALCEFTHHLDFNSFSQWERHRERVMSHPRYRSGELQCGLRINPECSTGHTAMYDPCVAGSRLGVTAEALRGRCLDGLSGLHFHTLCEQNSDDLETTLAAVEEKFGELLRLPQFRYLNMGGGHWITKPFYDRERLVRLVRQARESYGVEVWLEPGEAVAIHSGVLRAEVMDVFVSGGQRVAVLNISATAHMPDVLEMPYRPDVFLVEPGGAGDPDAPEPAVRFAGEHYRLAGDPDAPESGTAGWVNHRLGGPTCLAGDVVGNFLFPRELRCGDVLVFDDMAHYTMVKTTMFNGVKHPPIALQQDDGTLEVVRRFGYRDFHSRLG